MIALRNLALRNGTEMNQDARSQTLSRNHATHGTLNPEETSHQTITNLSTAPVKCGHCTLFSETNTARVAKKWDHPASP